MTGFEGERRFEVRRWGVGHRGLLLRTMHVDGEPRVEVWIKPAEVLSLPSWMDGLSIDEATSEQVEAWSDAHPGAGIGPDSARSHRPFGVVQRVGRRRKLEREEDREDFFAPSPWDTEQFK